MPRKTIPIYHGSDEDTLYVARTEVEIAERNLVEKMLEASVAAPARFGDAAPDPVVTARRQRDEKRASFNAVVDETAARAEEWVLESIGHEAWAELVADHPPREVDGVDGTKVPHPEDELFGVDTTTFGKAILLFVDPDDEEHRTVVKAGDLDLVKLEARLKRLSAGQFNDLWATAHALNTGGIADPKVTRYSTDTRSTAS